MRIIDIDFHGILFREYTQAELKQVTDVTARTIGFAQSFFNYGNVYIKTEGFQQNIEFLRTPQANKVVEIINRLLRNPEAYDQF
jgi:glucan biosynthesis protein